MFEKFPNNKNEFHNFDNLVALLENKIIVQITQLNPFINNISDNKRYLPGRN